MESWEASDVEVPAIESVGGMVMVAEAEACRFRYQVHWCLDWPRLVFVGETPSLSTVLHFHHTPCLLPTTKLS